MATYVLIHGGWHGGWCWKKVVQILRGAGHEVYAPTLTGTGDRFHLGSKNVNMSTHIQDIIATIEYEDLDNVILVGHSYGGLPVVGASEKIPNRLSHIVLLDAAVPQHGKAYKDISPDFYQYLKAITDAQGDGWLIPIPEGADFGIADPKDSAWAMSKLTAGGCMAALEEPISISDPAALALPRTYLICTKNGVQSDSIRFVEMPLRPNWKVRNIESGHDAMVDVPNQLAEMLMSL